ncbi:MAG: hypothetical protein U0175_26675 [Caldilineaceae bacterium]
MHTGQFIFNVTPIVTGDSGAAAALREAIVSFWQAYLQLESTKYLNFFTTDAIRLSERASAYQATHAAIQAGMAAEWEAFERPKNLISEKMTVEHAEFMVEGNFAIAIYWIDIVGGARWEYTDQGLVFQAWVKHNQQWQVAHHTDAWSLDYSVDSQQPGSGATFDFDFAYPVKDLARAIQFYTPLLGTPEAVTPTRASFNLKGSRFILDSSAWGGAAQVRKALPNGYALFTVNNMDEEVARLTAAKVKIGKPQKSATDSYCTGWDTDENFFVLWQKVFNSATDVSPQTSGFPTTPLGQAAQKVMSAWLHLDAATLNTLCSGKATWFDDTRFKHRGQERGAKIVPALQSVYWPCYDNGPHGMAAYLEVTNFHTLAFGSQQIVSYEMRLTGQGAHPFRNSAWVTQVFNQAQQLLHTMIVDNNRSNAPVLELDYTGYPTEDLAAARKFYSKQLRLGEGYDDEGYYGFWSNHAVFGLYEADPAEDHLPQARQANGYISFWVRSAQETYAYLKQNGCTFPVIPAINDKSEIDKQPGYTQVVTTDSEGSVILFTEYSGRPR